MSHPFRSSQPSFFWMFSLFGLEAAYSELRIESGTGAEINGCGGTDGVRIGGVGRGPEGGGEEGKGGEKKT